MLLGVAVSVKTRQYGEERFEKRMVTQMEKGQ